MNTDQRKAILSFLKKTLTPQRFLHVMSVTQLAQDLAEIHHLNQDQAEQAALLHDVARCWTDSQLKDYVLHHRIRIPCRDFLFKHQPLLLHCFVGAHLAKVQFLISDPHVLSAISKHTFADLEMSDLDQLLFVSDFAAPDRKSSEAAQVRQLAKKHLQESFKEALKLKLLYLLRSDGMLYPNAAVIWNQWIKK